MELKLEISGQNARCQKLLIVPYGIETIVSNKFLRFLSPFNRTLWN